MSENIIQGQSPTKGQEGGRRREGRKEGGRPGGEERGTNNSFRAKFKVLLMLDNAVQVIFHGEIDQFFSSPHIVEGPCFLFQSNLSLKGKTHLFP